MQGIVSDFDDVAASSSNTGALWCSISPRDYFHWRSEGMQGEGDGSGFGINNRGGIKTSATVANITSLTIVGGTADIAVGSKFILYKLPR